VENGSLPFTLQECFAAQKQDGTVPADHPWVMLPFVR